MCRSVDVSLSSRGVAMKRMGLGRVYILIFSAVGESSAEGSGRDVAVEGDGPTYSKWMEFFMSAIAMIGMIMMEVVAMMVKSQRYLCQGSSRPSRTRS